MAEVNDCPLLALTCSILRSRPGSEPQDCNPRDPLFPTHEGRQFEYSGFAKLFQRIGDRAGVGRFSAHLLRHTWATRFMGNGGDLLTLKRQGGWSESEMVERYRHTTPSRIATGCRTQRASSPVSARQR